MKRIIGSGAEKRCSFVGGRVKEIHYIQQPTEYLCGQACVAMIANVSVDDVIRVMNNDQATGKKTLSGHWIIMGSGRQKP